MHLGDKLKMYRKQNNLDQFQMAELLKISHRKYQDIEKTGIVLKTGDQEKIRNILAGNAQDDAQGSKKQDGIDPLSIIANLTESNRMLAEANLILANKINPESTKPPSQFKTGNHH